MPTKKPIATKQKNKKTKKPTLKLPKKIIAYLEKAGVPHEIITHKTVYTAYDAAQTMGKKLSDIAKSLLVKADKDYYVVILPADRNVDFDKLGKSIGKLSGQDVKTIKIPGEKIVQELLKLKNETVSAFGNAYKLPVIAEQGFAKLKEAVFSSGSFNHAVAMKVQDFMRMEQAKTGGFGGKKVVKKTPARNARASEAGGKK